MNRIHLPLGDIGRPEDRVVRIVNLHYAASSKDIRDFFGDGFTVIDFLRGVNPKTNKNTVGYVLFATEQERIDAQALSGSKILDREVKVMPAQGGFHISISGDTILPLSTYEHTDALCERGEAREDAPPAAADVEAFPSLSMAENSHLTVNMPTRTLAQRKPAQQRILQNRLLFLNNVGQGAEVNEMSFRLYFGNYVVVDVKRPLDPRTGLPHPTAFVMFASVDDRDAALHSLKNVPMQGRKLTLEVPKTFQNVDERGFMPTANENVVIFSTVPRDSVANATPLTPPLNNLDMCGGLPIAPTSRSFLPVMDIYNILRRQTGQLQAKKGDEQYHTQCVTSDNTAINKRQGENAKIVWGMPRAHMDERHQDQQQTLKRILSGVETPGQAIQGPTMTPHRFPSPITCVQCLVPGNPPPGVNTGFNPSMYNWALNGDQDPVDHVIREEEWHGGSGAIEQRIRRSRVRSAKPTVA